MKKLLQKNIILKRYLLLVLVIQGGICLNLVSGQNIKNGVNIQASYYNRGNVNLGWELMEDYPEIEALRIEIEPYRASRAIQWIREAHKENYQVIATYHNSDQLGSDRAEDLLEAARWWRNNYQSFISKGPIIINIMNEWGSHDITPEAYATTYNEAIAIIREVYDGLLIVDVPGFGQAAQIAADAYPLFKDQQIIFSVHLYSNAFNQEENRWMNEQDLAVLTNVGARGMVGEFCDGGRGGADWCSMIDYCNNNGWPIFGWAWNGDGGNMNMIEPHWRDQPFATSFRPTANMDKIIEKLAGIPCYTQPDKDCTLELIGDLCDDKNTFTINDRYNDYCHCTGRFSDLLSTPSTDAQLFIYPNPADTKHQLFIELIKVAAAGQLLIFNSLGQKVLTHSVSNKEKTINISINELPSGFYSVAFQSKGNILATSTFLTIANKE